MEEFAEDNVTIMIDLSPPVINNLWLTKGAILNISVHSVLELQNLTYVRSIFSWVALWCMYNRPLKAHGLWDHGSCDIAQTFFYHLEGGDISR